MRGALSASHLERRAFVYVRQSTTMQVQDHIESRQRQYGLVERAVGLGWSREDVVIVDEDQGKSGATSENRSGFRKLADAVGHGEAGAVLAIEVSRLARSSADWQGLLSVCAVADIVVIDEQSIYDPSDKDDRLLLDLKGTMSEAELHWLRLRLVGGRMNKARRGELELNPPIGYVWTDSGLTIDPDEAVARTIRVLFERFAIEPSAWAVVSWARDNGVRIPSRPSGDRTGEVRWRTLTQQRLCGLLRNPIYAGAYVYGRRPTRKTLVDGQIRHRRVSLAPDEWPVCIQDHHAAYIDWETYLRNRDKLISNRSRPMGATRGAPNAGPALLAGLILCGRCGRRMRTTYPGGSERRWSYVCIGKRDSDQSICWSVPGTPIDDVVNELFLDAVVPTELELSLAVEREADDQASSLEHQWRARIEQAGYAARLAERRYKAVDPDNRVVARTLEREWDQQLRELAEVQRQFQDAKRARRVELSDDDRAQIRALARDLPALWNAPTTHAADRKAMLRLVIEAITLSPIDVPRRVTRAQIQWHSGAVTETQIARPHRGQPSPEVVERIRALASEGNRDATIAAMLNNEGFLTGRQQPWSGDKVRKTRTKHGIERVAPPKPLEQVLPDRHPDTGHYSVPGAMKLLGASRSTIRRWMRRGLVAHYTQRYGRYNARWLVIDDPTAAELNQSR